jgi:GNAT superfamily N-acetyltransferase
MVGYSIRSVDGLAEVADVYAQVGFRPDLVDDLELVRRAGGEVFVASTDGRAVGVSSSLSFGSTGWVGGVAVLPEQTRRGLGRTLTERAMASLGDRGARTVHLYATEMARPLYARMGFEPEGDYVELVGPPLDAADSPAWVENGVGPECGLRPGRESDLPQVLVLDRRATGEDRQRLISLLWPRRALVSETEGAVSGYALRQSASSVGAVVAAGEDAADALLAASLAAADRPQRVGVAADQIDLIGRLQRLGYRPHLAVTRMHHGPRAAATSARRTAFNFYWG